MVTREQVLRLIDGGQDYEQAGRRLGISPGLAYMIATGLSAHDTAQQDPIRNEKVLAWVRKRALAEARPVEAEAANQAATRPGPQAPRRSKKAKRDGDAEPRGDRS